MPKPCSHRQEETYLWESECDEEGRIVIDPVTKSWKLTDRAERAHDAKWKRLLKKYHPMRFIDESLVASQRNPNPLHLAYGWAFPDEFLMIYAEHHQLQMPVNDLLAATPGKETVTYGALTEDEAQREDLCELLKLRVRRLVHRDLERRARINLLNVIPFADWHVNCMFALWTNYNVEQRGYERDDDELIDAMNAIEDAIEECGFKPELQWWYDWQRLPE